MVGPINGTVSAAQANAGVADMRKINKRVWAEINRIRAEQSLAGVTPAVTDTAPVFLDPVTLLDQSFALLAQTHGHAGDSFRTLLPEVQDNYLSAISDLIAQARAAAARA